MVVSATVLKQFAFERYIIYRVIEIEFSEYPYTAHVHASCLSDIKVI